jgi:hypothetical protein
MSRRLLAVIVLTPFLAASLLVAQTPSLGSVLAKAGEYVANYNQTYRLLVAEESYQQLLRPYGSTRNDLLASGAQLGEMGTPKLRKIRSDGCRSRCRKTTRDETKSSPARSRTRSSGVSMAPRNRAGDRSCKLVS